MDGIQLVGLFAPLNETLFTALGTVPGWQSRCSIILGTMTRNLHLKVPQTSNCPKPASPRTCLHTSQLPPLVLYQWDLGWHRGDLGLERTFRGPLTSPQPSAFLSQPCPLSKLYRIYSCQTAFCKMQSRSDPVITHPHLLAPSNLWQVKVFIIWSLDPEFHFPL